MLKAAGDRCSHLCGRLIIETCRYVLVYVQHLLCPFYNIQMSQCVFRIPPVERIDPDPSWRRTMANTVCMSGSLAPEFGLLDTSAHMVRFCSVHMLYMS